MNCLIFICSWHIGILFIYSFSWTLSATRYFCLIMPIVVVVMGEGEGVAHSAPPTCINPDRKMLLTWYFCSYKNDGVTNYVICFEKLCKKWQKYFFFLKLTLWQPGKSFQDNFQPFKIKITCKWNIYRLIC